jgi:hypothetical protein
MSEDRRKRQQDRSGEPSDPARTKKLVQYGIVAILFAGAFFGGRYYHGHKYDSFAQCLTAKQTKMYGLYWCPHCIEEKEKFGDSFHFVNYEECAIKGSQELAPACKVAGVKLFPSWQFAGEQPKEGVLSLEALSDKTGCKLP